MTSEPLPVPYASDGSTREDTATPLTRLEPGSEAVIAGQLRGDSPVSRRLADLGFLEGTPVRVLRRAPLGDPIVFELRGYRICLRRSEADTVLVRRLPDARSEPSARRAAEPEVGR